MTLWNGHPEMPGRGPETVVTGANTPAEKAELARYAVFLLSRDWIQSEWGDRVIDLVTDALDAYIKAQECQASRPSYTEAELWIANTIMDYESEERDLSMGECQELGEVILKEVLARFHPDLHQEGGVLV